MKLDPNCFYHPFDRVDIDAHEQTQYLREYAICAEIDIEDLLIKHLKATDPREAAQREAPKQQTDKTRPKTQTTQPRNAKTRTQRTPNAPKPHPNHTQTTPNPPPERPKNNPKTPPRNGGGLSAKRQRRCISSNKTWVTRNHAFKAKKSKVPVTQYLRCQTNEAALVPPNHNSAII